MENKKELKHFLEELHAIFNGSDGFVYISDPNTYEVLFVSEKFKEKLGGKCYEVIRGLKAPCAFCTNKQIFGENLGRAHVWEFHSEQDKRWYRCVDKAVQWPGKRYVRLEIAIDVTEYKNMEKALKESEEQYRSLVEAAPDVVYSISSEGKLTSLNSAFEKITGWKREEWLGKPFTALIHPEDIALAVESFQKTLRGEPEPVELRVLSKSGDYLIGEFISVPLIKNGKIVGELGIARDITNRKLFEGKLHETTERLQALVQAIPDIVFFKDVQGRNLVVNSAFERFVGLSQKDIIGKTDDQLFPADLAAYCKRSDQEVLRKGTIVRAEEQTTNDKGEKKFFETIKAPIYDSQGNIVGIVGVSRDVTERKLMEERLREREELFRSVVESSHDGIAIVDENYKIIYANNLLTKITGYSKEELIGQDFRKFLAKESKAIVKKMDIRKMMQEQGKRMLPLAKYEFKIVRKDCEKRDVEAKAKALMDAYGRIIIIAQVLDITEQKRLEEERKLYERRLSELNRYAHKLNMAKNLNEIFRLTLDAARKTLGFEYASIFILEEKNLRMVAQLGYPKPPKLVLPINGEMGIVTRAARKGEPVNIPDVRKDKAYVKTREGMLSELAVPMKVRSKVLGVLNVESHKLAAFDEDDRKLLEILASHAATAISNIKRQKSLALLSEKLEHLIQSSTKIMQIKDMHKRLRAIAKTIQKFGWRRVAISLMDENLELKDMVALGFTKEEIKTLTERKVPEHLLKKLLDPKFEKYKIGEFYYPPWNDQQFPREIFSEYMTVWHLQDLLYAPIRTLEGRIVGMLTMEGPVNGSKPARETLMPIELFLHHVAIILENAQLIENLERAREELRQYADQLEQKVEERTRELTEFQDKLLKAQRLAVIGELAGMVGHDLRNPLTSMLTATYYMKKRLATEEIDGKIMEMIELIEKNIAYSNKIISDLLDYSRETKLDLVETDPKTMVKEALSSVEIPKGIRVVNRARSTVKIKVDFEKMKRTFINLIKNAVEAMSDGETGTLTIRSRKMGDKVMFAFSDTGVGMSEEVMKKIWNPLFTTKAKGMGFGLSICKRFVEAHGGSIDVESAPGKGTTFTVKIPIEPKIEGGEKVWLKAQESSLLTTTKP